MYPWHLKASKSSLNELISFEWTKKKEISGMDCVRE